ncbi:MAG: inositol monophosphatase family protein [Corynebacterium sp.]|nr:inositol monophosphatase family protein [Corynebacterium sp.]
MTAQHKSANNAGRVPESEGSRIIFRELAAYQNEVEAAIKNTSADVAELRAFAEELVASAAGLVSKHRAELAKQADISAFSTSKSSAVDPVTVVDQACEVSLVNAIEQRRPLDGIIGEEGANKPSRSGLSWVIDPIDGTVNFMYGVAEYAVSVAVVAGEICLAGAVINIPRNELYSAAAGQGATVRHADGSVEILESRSEANPAMSLIATGFGYGEQRRFHQARLLTTLLPQVRDIRRMGSAALDLCRVAEGTVDAYYEHGIKLWDVAAGAIIALEAGCWICLPETLWEPGHDSGRDIVWTSSAALAERFEALLIDAHGCTLSQ